MHLRIALFVAGLIALGPSAPARATVLPTSVSVTGKTLTINGGAIANDVQIRLTGKDTDRVFFVSDAATTVTAGEGCTAAGSELRCPVPTPDARVEMALRGGDDRFQTLGDGFAIHLEALLGPGNDAASLGPESGFCGDYTCRLLGEGGAEHLVGGTGTGTWLVGGRGDDELIAHAQSHIAGEGGDDLEVGSPESDVISDVGRLGEDSGADVIYGKGGNDGIDEVGGADRIYGGGGDDQISRSRATRTESSDLIEGGAGTDLYVRHCGSCRVSLDGIANDGRRDRREGDNITEFEVIDVENYGSRHGRFPFGSGADRVIGDRDPNTIFAGRGPDLVVGRGGADELYAGAGVDLIRAADGERDELIGCGAGLDRAIVDPIDRPNPSCEQVVVRR